MPPGTKGGFGLEDLRTFTQLVEVFVNKGDMAFMSYRNPMNGRSAVESVFRVAARII